MNWEKYLKETTITGGYPNDGSTGPASDDDLSVGTTVFGDKMVPVEVPNRLTGMTIKYVPADELDQDWNYDEFDHSTGMGSHKSYSKTLNSLDKILNDRLWKRTDNRKFKLQKDKHDARKSNDIDQTNKLSDDEEETMEITEKISIYLNLEETMMNEAEISTNDRKSLAKVLLSGKNSKVKIKSLNVDAVVTNYDNEIIITYPKNDDLTMSLVDVSDSLGMEFKTTKDGNKIAFRMIK